MLAIFIIWLLGAAASFLILMSLAIDSNKKINVNVLKMFLLASLCSWITVIVYLGFIISSKINENRS